MQRKRDIPLFFAILFAMVFAARWCHRSVLWADEDYHLAAAIQVLHGKIPYRDIWYDKPPLNLAFYLLFGARTGWMLRAMDALFVTGAAALAFRFAAQLWTRREGFLAAALLAFYLIFYLPDSTIPLEPDTLMIAPHLAAVYFAWRRRPFAAGVLSGIAFLLNAKGLFVLAACAIFDIGSLAPLLAGFLAPSGIALGWLAAAGAFGGYIDQVWKWGLLYVGNPAADTARKGAGLAVSWMLFHAVLVIGAAVYWWRNRTRQGAELAVWASISLAGTGLGWRFTPRYFNQLLPALIIPAARGIVIAWDLRRFAPAASISNGARAMRIALLAALLASIVFPVARFGPRFLELARDEFTGSPQVWRDVELDRDSRAAAGILNGMAKPGDSIFVWGYRPDLVAYSRLPIASRFWDSQPLTGIPADRHLDGGNSIAADWASANRSEFVRSRPTFFVDGLSLLSPHLDVRLWGVMYMSPILVKRIGPEMYPDLKLWLLHYCEAGRTPLTVIYRRCEIAASP